MVFAVLVVARSSRSVNLAFVRVGHIGKGSPATASLFRWPLHHNDSHAPVPPHALKPITEATMPPSGRPAVAISTFRPPVTPKLGVEMREFSWDARLQQGGLGFPVFGIGRLLNVRVE